MQPLFPDVDVEKVDEAGQIIMYILIVLYSILFIACVAALVHAMRTSKEWNVVKFMKVLLPLPILARIISFLFGLNDPDYMTGVVSQQTFWQMFITAIPGYLMFSVFSLLVLFFVYLFYLSSSKIEVFMKTFIGTYLVANALVYLLWIVLLILMLVYPDEMDYIHEVEATYSAFLFVVVGAGFCLYGTKLLIVLRKQQQMTFITKRVFVLTIVCTILMMLQSIWTLLNQFVFDSDTGLISLFGATFNDLFCELLPVAFILLVLCWPSTKVAYSEVKDPPPEELALPVRSYQALSDIQEAP